jgi:cytoskeleton protein RodZ
MFEIGGSLREARERRDLSLDDAQERTLIRVRYLAALEDERFSILPGDFYVRTFLREYADFLGLDGDVYVEEYLSRHPPQPEPAPAPPPRLRVRDLSLLRPAIALAVVLVVVVAAWTLTGSSPKRQTLGTESFRPPVRTPPHRTSTPRTTTAPRRPATSLVLTATDGPCWLLVRLGSRAGTEVYEGTIQPGQTVRFGLRKALWIRLGAPWNVDASIGGRTVDALPQRTGDVLARPSGLTSA